MRDALLARIIVRFFTGDIQGFSADVAALESLAEEGRSRLARAFVHVYHAGQALLAGDFDGSEELAESARHAASGDVDVDMAVAAHLAPLRWHHGRHEAAIAIAKSVVERSPAYALMLPAIEAQACARDGDLHRARELIRQVTARDGEAVGYDIVRSAVLAWLAEACALVGAPDAAAVVWTWLEPSKGQLAGAMGPVGVVGAVDRFLGMLAATQKKWDEAEAHYRSALELETRIASPVLVAETQLWYGRMLLERDAAGDREQGVELLSAALDTAEKLGMAFVVSEARRLLRPEFPRGIETSRTAVFVGRTEELSRLGTLWAEVRSGRLRAALLAGEPGIGKTRLAAELARSAYEEGAMVLFGRCDEEMLVPYQPFVEALRHYVATCPLSTLRAQLQGLGGELTRLLPKLGQRVADLPPPLRAEPETERYRLFEAVTTLLMSMAQAQPVVLLLDDLHWADKPTLLLFRHILRSLENGALLVIGNYRDTDLTPSHPLADLLADLRREQLSERILLSGLSQAEVSDLLQTMAGHDVPAELGSALHRETEGNPFFIGEVLRHLAETGAISRRDGRWTTSLGIDQLGIPEGVREVVGRRLLHLSADANQALTIASVIGREFGLDVLERVSELSTERLLETLDEAAAARLVAEVPGAADRYAFSHTLIRETLYRNLATPRRIRVHRQIGEALEALYGDSTSHLPELALHFYEAAHAGDLQKATEYCRRAGETATALLAYEEAAGHYERALQALELADRARGKLERGELLLMLGQAQWRSGEIEKAKETFEQAASLARALDAPELLARAALGYGSGLGGAGFALGTDVRLVSLLEEGLRALPECDSVLRARLLSRLAVELYFTPSIDTVDRRSRLSSEALEMASRLGDRPARLVALYSRHWALLGPDVDIDERLAIGAEMIALASESGDREMTLPRPPRAPAHAARGRRHRRRRVRT